MGRRCGNGIVFTWGIINDGRLGIAVSEKDKDKDRVEEQNYDLVACKPCVVKFDENIII